MCDYPRPDHAGEVVDAPVYIRVRPGWFERVLLVAVITQIFLSALFIFYGSNPARGLRQDQMENRKILCANLYELNQTVYVNRFVPDGICPARP